MEYSDEYLRGQLPGENPPAAYVPPEVTREITSYIEAGEFPDPALLSRSVRWTYTIFSEMGLGQFRFEDRRVPWDYLPWAPLHSSATQSIAVGLYDRDREAPGFGLSINLAGWDGPDFYIAGYVNFERLGQRFPIAIRRTTTELHSAPNPINATTTCWARCNSTSNWGIITAGHAIGTSTAGVSVPLDNGSTGISHRCFWQPIDAAFLLTTAPTNSPSLLSIVHFPAAGIPVTVESRNGPQHRTVASACNSLGFYKTRVFPILFFLDQPCSPGDSGALVQIGAGQAAGIYNGAQPSPATGGTSGLVLNFAQAMFALDTTAFR